MRSCKELPVTDCQIANTHITKWLQPVLDCFCCTFRDNTDSFIKGSNRDFKQIHQMCVIPAHFISEIKITSDPNLALIKITSDQDLTLQACVTQAAASLSLPHWRMLRGLSARSQRRQLMRRTSLLFFRSLKTSLHNYKQSWTSFQLLPTIWVLPACNEGHKKCKSHSSWSMG